MKNIPSSENGVNTLSSRRHVLMDALSQGLPILSGLHLCRDESSDVRDRFGRDSPGCKEGELKAKDLLSLRTVLSELKLDKVFRVPSVKVRRAGGIKGRGCALTGGFFSHLTLVPKVQLISFGNGAGDRKNVIRSLDVCKPLIHKSSAT